MNLDHIDFSFFKEFLKQIEEQGNANCIIAGGCLRDIIFNKPVKDIDVFYWGKLPIGLTKVVENLEQQEDFGYVDNNQCTHKAFYKGFPVDFIKVPNGTGWSVLLDSFPASISRVGMSISGNLLWRSSFEETYDTKKIKYKNENKYTNYIYKILVKYPAYEFEYIDEESIFKQTVSQAKLKPLKPTVKLTTDFPVVRYKVINIKSTEAVFKVMS